MKKTIDIQGFFRDSHKRKILSAEFASLLSAQIIVFAVPMVAVTTLNSSNSEVGLINTFAGLGVFFFLALLSPLSDVARKDFLLGFISLVRGMITAIVAYSLLENSLNISLLCAFVFFIAGSTALYDSAFSAALPILVEKDHLSKMNSWVAGLRTATDIGAGSIAGIGLAIGGATSTFALVAALYFLSSLGPFSLKTYFVTSPPSNSSDQSLGPNSFLQGFRILISNPIQFRLNLGIAHFNIFTTIIQTMYIAYAIRYAHMSEVQVGLAASIGGALGLTGVFMASPLIEKLSVRTLMSATLVVPGLAAFAIYFIPSLTPSVATIVLGTALGVWAASILINISAFETLKQLMISPIDIVKYTAASRLMTWGLDPIGAGLAAAASLVLPLDAVMMLGSLGIITSSCWIFFSKRMINVPIPKIGHLSTDLSES